MIERATVWNLTDAAGQRCGQAATFRDWSPMPDAERRGEAGADRDRIRGFHPIRRLIRSLWP